MEQLQSLPAPPHAQTARLAYWALSFAFVAFVPSGTFVFFLITHLPLSQKIFSFALAHKG